MYKIFLYFLQLIFSQTLKKVHNGPVFAICVLKDGSVVTGGGKDGKLIHFDGNYKKSDLEAEVNRFKKFFWQFQMNIRQI